MEQTNLRNRKQTIDSGNDRGKVPERDEEPKRPRNDIGENDDADDDDDDDHSQGLFHLTPLIQRPLLMRLDVGPFLLAYAGLIMFDSLDPISQWTVVGGIPPTTLAFALTLLLHLVTVLLTQWRVTVKSDVGYFYPARNLEEMNQWTHCLLQAKHKELNGSVSAGIVAVVPVANDVTVVRFQDRTFRCSRHSPDADVSLWRQESDVQQQQHKPASNALRFKLVSYPTNEALSWYAAWMGHSTLHSTVTAGQVYGRNTTALQLPTFIELLSQQMLAPFFLFQVFCVVLWSLDEYWYFALFTLFALILFESTLAYNRLKGLERLHGISHRHQNQRVWVRRGMDAPKALAWMSIPVAELVPGDFVSLSGSHLNVPADILLLHGTAVCDEALLTGESVPQLKQPLDVAVATAQTRLDMQDSDHKESILFGGTVLLVGTPPSDASTEHAGPSLGITGIVLRTGFETEQGKLLRTMVHTSTSTDGVHTFDTFVFIFLLILCAIGAAAYVLQEGWNDERRNRFRLTLHVVIILTSVVPPELPMELSLAVTNSVADLMKRCKVYCTEHFRIPWAGEVNVCCFDKTGTLTSDEMILRGVRLFDKKSNDADTSSDEDKTLLQPEESDLPWETIRIMAACHSLAPMHNGSRKVIGDPLEKTVMKSTGYHLMGVNVVAGTSGHATRENYQALQILHRFAFSSKLKRMTVLATEIEGDGKVWALTKGAPETIKSLLSSESLPDNFDTVAFHHMSRGRRVLAMAYREVGRTNKFYALKDGGRDKVEHNLTFAGFLVLDCPLKPDSKSVIAELQKSGHDVVMITGDAILTAVEVARQVGIVRRPSSANKSRDVYRIVKRELSLPVDPTDPLSFFECVELSPCANTQKSFVLSSTLVSSWKQDGRRDTLSLCVSGDTLVSLAETVSRIEKTSEPSKPTSTLDEKNLLLKPSAQAVLAKVVSLVSVFARHAPHQKEAVIAAFNAGGYQTLMCGDGTNDVGALKRAHIGISIISAPGVEKKQREASAQVARVKGSAKTKKGIKAKTIEDSLRQLRDAQVELDQVELGDASVAAPFTSRAVSIKCCKDVLQQGRCTLVTMISIYKILGINCLVNALVLSKLFIHGGKQGDRQLTVLGIGVATLFFFVTRAEPLPMLSAIRPPSSVLCRQTFFSMTGQCLIHMSIILFATEMALAFVDPYDPSLVPDGPFNPNVLNTCTFLLMCLSTINTFAINYRGRPFMKDLHENKLFYRSLQVCYAVLAISTLEIFPPLNDLLQLTTATTLELSTVTARQRSLASYPWVEGWVQTVEFPFFMAALMLLDTAASFGFERFLRRIFDRK